MKKNTKILTTLFIIVTLTCGCLQIQDQNIKTMSAQQFSDGIEREYNNTEKFFRINFKLLNEGDIVVIRDIIDDINYLSDSNTTKIEFKVNTTSPTGEQIETIEFEFIGDITDSYKKNDAINITCTIKHVIFSYEGWNFNCEVFKEGWDQNYYIDNSFLQLLPQNRISHAS